MPDQMGATADAVPSDVAQKDITVTRSHRPNTAKSAQPRPASASSSSPGGHGAGLLFLREEEIRLAQDLLFFAYRDFTNAADVVLVERGLGRAHHRTLHFIGRNPGMTVTGLLGILGITKQSLARVLTVLIEQGLVTQSPGRSDRRQRLLALTADGVALEQLLFERQRECLTAAFREAGAASVEGFRQVLRGIMTDGARKYIDRAEARGQTPRAAW